MNESLPPLKPKASHEEFKNARLHFLKLTLRLLKLT